MEIALSAYQYQAGKVTWLVPVVPGLFEWSVQSGDPGKVRQRLIERVRKEIPRLDRRHFARLHVPASRRLARVHLQFTLEDDDDKRTLAGFFPVVLEERESGGERGLTIAYHPLAPAKWFEPNGNVELGQELARHYANLFSPSDSDRIKSNGIEKLVTLRFQADAPSLRSLLRRNKQADSELAGAGRSGNLAALLRVSVNQSARAANGELPLGLPRERERQRLNQLLAARERSSVLLVGSAGCGKSALVAQAVYDLLAADDYPSHGNLDRVRNVIAMSGRQIIAGMSYVGQWEARCVELLARCKQNRLILWVDDLQAFPSIGRSTVSERSLADFFKGPLARGELTIIAECTPEGLVALEREAPGLVSAFTRVPVGPATPAQTTSMMLHTARRLEHVHDIAFDPRCFGTLLEQSAALSSSLALPGRALTPLKALSKSALRRSSESEGIEEVTPEDVIGFFSAQTGLPRLLLTPEAPLNRAQLLSELATRVMGQAEALEAVTDLILSLRCRLCGPGRPYGVYLFTGPTGTGKTELAKCMTEYLYGSQQRLLRFDMGEFNGPDAVSRLIGDASAPLGLLTSAVRAQPFCVLLFDEVEKAHPAVLNLMLQLFEDARLTDAQGQVTDFSHSVVVLTSNLGTAGKSVRGFAEDGARQAADIARAVREFFPPELFNRIDRIVPFAPLSRVAALEIVQKQLKLLAGRPGLSERSTFVRFTDAVVKRAAEDGYDAEYGARSLKRHIDREIAGALTRTINAEGPAEMRLLWLYAEEAGRGVGVRAEALRETEPDSAPNPLGWLFERNFSELRAELPTTLARLLALESDPRMLALGQHLSQELERYRLGDQRRADQIFTLDSLLSHARALARRLEALLHFDPELQALERQRKQSEGLAPESLDYSTIGAELGRRFEREPRFVPLDVLQSPSSARALVRDLAEVALLEGLLARAHEADRHVATIEITRLAMIHEQRRFSSGSPGLCEWLTQAYAAARGELDAAAIAGWDGTMKAVSARDLPAALEAHPKQVVLRMVGPGVTDYFEREQGCHVRRTLASGPEIVRVRVFAGDHEPLAWVQRHHAQLLAFERGLEGHGPVVDNPEALLPVIRSLRFDPIADQPATLRVEDYRLLYVAQRNVRRVEELLSDLFLLAAGAARDPEAERDRA